MLKFEGSRGTSEIFHNALGIATGETSDAKENFSLQGFGEQARGD
jgi:hypothetical protein